MMRRWFILLVVAGCSSPAPRPAPTPPEPPELSESAPVEALLPRAPGEFAPSFMTLAGDGAMNGETLSDVDTCSTCHADIADQWGASAHSFASFNNPIYRVNVELARHELGNKNSQHCGGCHDISLQLDGLMLGEIPADDLRAHSGVTCRLCHGVDEVTKDGNGSYVLSREPIMTPDMDDAASVAAHKAQATVKPLGTELCVGCHRGFLSPDLDVPVHLSGIDEPTFWRSSAYTGSGVGRVDKVEKKTCIDCHMASEAAGEDEVAAHDGKVASHRFLGGHSWMAGMRGDAEQLARTQKMLEGVASIDVQDAPGSAGGFDVIVRNLLVGHRFPGGVNDVQDTWIEVEVRDARGALIASSGLTHEDDATDTEAHVLRSYPVGDDGEILEDHELPHFRAVIANQTIAARDAIAERYVFETPAKAALPLRVEARLRHRSRSLAFQKTVCAESKTPGGQAFLAGTRAARDADLDPCRKQPVTEIARTSATLGQIAPSWERRYEHGMALVSVISERLDEPRTILERALEITPAGADGAKPRAMILTQLGAVASRQGRTDDALALLAKARAELQSVQAPEPPVLDFVAADACARVWRWQEAATFAAAASVKAPLNTGVWVMLARARGSLGDDRGALEAAKQGLALSPRDPDLLRSQATALRSLDGALADAALAAFERFRAPDDAAALRIQCAGASARCAREREAGHTHVMTQAK
jgi:tetratricopeptide (TPR) repeat protein